jgi:hypothetical protein
MVMVTCAPIARFTGPKEQQPDTIVMVGLKGQAMEHRTTVLGLLRKARDLVSTRQHPGIIEAISSLKGEASGRTRDLAYYALLETMMMSKGEASISVLCETDAQGDAVELFDATIRRIASTLH